MACYHIPSVTCPECQQIGGPYIHPQMFDDARLHAMRQEIASLRSRLALAEAVVEAARKIASHGGDAWTNNDYEQGSDCNLCQANMDEGTHRPDCDGLALIAAISACYAAFSVKS